MCVSCSDWNITCQIATGMRKKKRAEGWSRKYSDSQVFQVTTAKFHGQINIFQDKN